MGSNHHGHFTFCTVKIVGVVPLVNIISIVPAFGGVIDNDVISPQTYLVLGYPVIVTAVSVIVSTNDVPICSATKLATACEVGTFVLIELIVIISSFSMFAAYGVWANIPSNTLLFLEYDIWKFPTAFTPILLSPKNVLTFDGDKW